ncbi:MAG: S46 family peptidase, partial [Pseudomonadota bacterium]
KYASTVAGYNNALKNLTGQIAGAKRADLVGRRAAREAALNQWLKASEVRADDLAAIEAVDELAIESAAASREGMAYSRAKASALVGTAQSLYRLAKEREKDDAEREKGYQDRDLPFFRQRMERMERRFDPVVDKALWLNGLAYYYGSDEMGRFETFHTAMKLPADFDSDAIGGMLDDYYAGTTLMDLDQRVALMEASAADLEAMDDPFMQLAVTLHDHDMKREADEKTRKGQSTALRPAYMRAIIDWQRSEGKVAYPDANSTLRITYGTVQGGSPRDGMRHEAFTTLEGIVEKDTGEAPFNAPTAQLDAIKARDHGDYAMEELGSVPVNFMADMDVTGGNSGSATLNARAELVGLLFDMTLEAVNSDWDFNPKLSRTIQVDTRYMLWVMEQVDGAGHLIDEMQIVR